MSENGDELEPELIQCELSSGTEPAAEYDDPDDSKGTLVMIISLLSYCLHKSLCKKYKRY